MCEDNEGNENPYPDCDKYYSTDLSISIVEIKAGSREQAEAIMQEFINKIAPIMEDKISWQEANWEIEENVLNKQEGVWEMSDVEADADTLASAGYGTDEDYA
jgi:L-lysine 2,3-aminomutase